MLEVSRLPITSLDSVLPSAATPTTITNLCVSSTHVLAKDSLYCHLTLPEGLFFKKAYKTTVAQTPKFQSRTYKVAFKSDDTRFVDATGAIFQSAELRLTIGYYFNNRDIFYYQEEVQTFTERCVVNGSPYTTTTVARCHMSGYICSKKRIDLIKAPDTSIPDDDNSSRTVQFFFA